jgi:hypothetical protein
MQAMSWKCVGHEKEVHKEITDAATTYVASNSQGYISFINTISDPTGISLSLTDLGGAPKTPKEWMTFGSFHEDDIDAPGDAGGIRSVNHFYDPFTKQGLSDWPFPNFAGVLGQNSFFWASTAECPGIDIKIVGPWVLPIYNTGTYNVWSFPDARQYQWRGLTEADPNARSKGLANMFRALGQVVHLLQDASQPQHVRNEQHLSFAKFGG